MLNWIYETLARIGYHHPLHPAVTHIPVGLVMGAFIFALTAWIFNRESLSQSAKHCIILALLAVPPVALLGFMDWQHFYAGSSLPPIRIKMMLAPTLALLLLVAWGISRKENRNMSPRIVVYGLCLVTVIALGFFGGELVYGVRGEATASADTPAVRRGGELFSSRCSLCHFADKSDTKIGPGFKGLFKRDQLPVSQKPVTEEAISNQLKSPVGKMPAFPDLSPEQIKELIAYLKTL
jgi:uncharacterized membrane protein